MLKAARAATGSAGDPLGIRGDFPLLETTNFLNTAYHSVSPAQVVEAGVEFYKARGNPADGIGPWIGEGRAIRATFAKMVGAEPSEIGLDSNPPGHTYYTTRHIFHSDHVGSWGVLCRDVRQDKQPVGCQCPFS